MREQAEMTIEAVSLFPGAVGTVQVAVSPPEDVQGPLWLVGPPDAVADNLQVILVGWALGPCSDAAVADDEALRLCLAVYTPGTVRPEGMLVGAVVDARAEARRFSVIGEVTVP